MAKKTLTPEQAEIKAMKKAKSSQNWTKFWAIVLALVLTVGVVFLGKTQADMAIEAAGTAQGGDETPGTQTPGTETPGTQTPGTETPGTETPGTETPGIETPGTETPGTETPGTETPGTQTPGTQTPDAPAENATAKAIALLNKVTAAAAKGSYNWTRVCDYTADGKIDVGSATSTLNGIITRVDPNASLDTVVGGFLGIGNKEAKVANGKFPETGMSTEDYMLRGMGLKAEDVNGDVQVNGDVYTFNIKSCNNPKKTNNNALYRVTNDFFTHEEVESGLKSQLGALSSLLSLKSSNVDYTNIKVVATIKNEKLTNLVVSYEFAAELQLQATLIPITGKGKATNTMTYSNIAY